MIKVWPLCCRTSGPSSIQLSQDWFGVANSSRGPLIVSGSLIGAMYRFCKPSVLPGQPDQMKYNAPLGASKTVPSIAQRSVVGSYTFPLATNEKVGPVVCDSATNILSSALMPSSAA